MSPTKDDLRHDLESAREALLEAASKLSAEDWQQPSPNDGWTARDTLAHLASAEGSMIARIKRGLAGEAKLPPDFDLNFWNRRQVEKRQGKSPDELLAELAASRVEALALLDSLSADQLETGVEHALEKQATVAWIFGQIARHERLHAQDLHRSDT